MFSTKPFGLGFLTEFSPLRNFFFFLNSNLVSQPNVICSLILLHTRTNWELLVPDTCTVRFNIFMKFLWWICLKISSLFKYFYSYSFNSCIFFRKLYQFQFFMFLFLVRRDGAFFFMVLGLFLLIRVYNLNGDNVERSSTLIYAYSDICLISYLE